MVGGTRGRGGGQVITYSVSVSQSSMRRHTQGMSCGGGDGGRKGKGWEEGGEREGGGRGRSGVGGGGQVIT